MYLSRLAFLPSRLISSLGYTFTSTGRPSPSAKKFKSSSTLQSQDDALASSWAEFYQLSMHCRLTAYADAVAPLTLQLWHERLNHKTLDPVERAVQHVGCLIIDFKTRPPQDCPSCAVGKQPRDPFLPFHLLIWCTLG